MARTGHYMRHKEAKAEGRQMGSPAPQKIDSGERLRGLAGLLTRSPRGSSAHHPHRRGHWSWSVVVRISSSVKGGSFSTWAVGYCAV